jgi:hypothetical protein
MPTGKDHRLTNIAGVIRGLSPAHPTKAIERALNCSPRQAQRIVETGQVPRAFYSQVVEFLRRSADYNRQRLAEYEAEIQRLEAARSEDKARSAPSLGDDP